MVAAKQRTTLPLILFPVSGLLTIYNVLILRGEIPWCSYLLLVTDVVSLLVGIHPSWMAFAAHTLTIVAFHQLFLIFGNSKLVWLSMIRVLIPTSSSIQYRWIFRLMQALLLPFAIAGGWVWIACPFSPLSNCNNDNNWINHDDVVDANNVSDVMVRSMYFVLQSFTTVGFGDVLPQNKSEVAFCIFLTVISMLFWNGFNSLVVSCTKWFNYNSLAIADEVATLRSWLAASSLPQSVERMMLSHKLQLPGGLSVDNLWHKLPASIIDSILGNSLTEILSIDSSLFSLQSKNVLSYACFGNYMKGVTLFDMRRDSLNQTLIVLDGKVQFQSSSSSAKEDKNIVVSVGSTFVAAIANQDIVRMQTLDNDNIASEDEVVDQDYDMLQNRLAARQKALFMVSAAGNKMMQGRSSKHRNQVKQLIKREEHNVERILIVCLLSMLLVILTWTLITPITALITAKVNSLLSRSTVVVVDLCLIALYIFARATDLVIRNWFTLSQLAQVKVWGGMRIRFTNALFAGLCEVCALVPCYLFLTSVRFEGLLAIFCYNRCLLVFRIPILLATITSYFQSSVIMSSIQSSSIVETIAWSCFLGSSLICLWIYIWTAEYEQSSSSVYGTYWVFTVMSTTGYGEIVPENMKEIWLAMVSLVFGPATFSLLIAYIVNFIFSKDTVSKQLHDSEIHRILSMKYLRMLQLDEENQLVGSASITQELQLPLTHFEITMDVERVITNSNLGMETLSQIKSLLCGELVRRSRLFRNQSESVVNAAVQHLRQLLYNKHTSIISAANNHRSRGIYFVRTGTVQIKFTSALACRRFAGDYFGEESFYVASDDQGAAQRAEIDTIENAKAMSDSELWLLPEQALYSILKSEQIPLASIIQPRVKRPSKPSRTLSRSASLLLRMRKKFSLCNKVYHFCQRTVFTIWTYLLRISVLFYALIIPYQIGFGCDNTIPTAVEIAINSLLDACWILYLFYLYCVNKAQKPKERYMLLTFVLFAVIPLEAFTLLVNRHQSSSTYQLLVIQLFYILRLNKLLCCFVSPSSQQVDAMLLYLFPHTLDRTHGSVNNHRQSSFIARLVYCMCISTVLLLLVANACASVFFLIARFADSHHTNNWLMEYLGDSSWSASYCNASTAEVAPSHSSWQLYLISLYWSMAMLTTTGYGDIYPVTHVERLVNVVLYGCGTFFFAVAFSNLILVFSEESNARENHTDRVKLANRVLNFENASEDDKSKSNEALELQWKHFKGYDISRLRDAIGTQRYHILMSELVLPSFNDNFLFARLNIGFLEDLAAKMTMHVIPKGFVITSAGVLVDELLALITGEVVFDNRNDAHHYHHDGHHSSHNATLHESTQRVCNNNSNVWRRGRANDRQEYKRQQNGLVNVSEFVQRNASACTVWTSKECCVARVSYTDFHELAMQHQMIPLLLRCMRTVSRNELVKYSTEELVRHYKVNRMKIKIDKIIPLMLNHQSNTSFGMAQKVASTSTALICVIGALQLITAPLLLLFIEIEDDMFFFRANHIIDITMQISMVIYFAAVFWSDSIGMTKVQPVTDTSIPRASFIFQQKWTMLCCFPYSLIIWLVTTNQHYYTIARLICIVPTAVLVSQSYSQLHANDVTDNANQARKWYVQLAPSSQNIILVMVMILYASHLFACILVGFSSEHQYQLSLFWSLYTLSTIGYGSVSLQGSVQLLIAVSALLSASFLCSLLSAGINDSVDRIINKYKDLRRMKSAIQQYLSTHQHDSSVIEHNKRNNPMQDIQEYTSFLETNFDGSLYSEAYSSVLFFSQRHMFLDCYSLLRSSPCIQQMCHVSQVEGMIHSICRVLLPYYAGRNEVLLRRQRQHSRHVNEDGEHVFILRRGQVVCNETRVDRYNNSSQYCVHTFGTPAVINDFDPTVSSPHEIASDQHHSNSCGSAIKSVVSVDFLAADLTDCNASTVTVVVWSSDNYAWVSSSPAETTNEKEEHVYSFKAFSLVPEDSPLRKLISFPQSNLYSSDSVGLRVYLSHNGKMFYECCCGSLDRRRCHEPQKHQQNKDDDVKINDEDVFTTESFENGKVRLRKSKKPAVATHRILQESVEKKHIKSISSWLNNKRKPSSGAAGGRKAFYYKENSDTSDDSDNEGMGIFPPNRSSKAKSATNSADAVKLFSVASIAASIHSVIDTNSSSTFHTLSASSNTCGDNEVIPMSTNEEAADAVTAVESNLLTIILADNQIAKCTMKVRLQASFNCNSQRAVDESDDMKTSWSYECTEPSHLLRLHIQDRINVVNSYRAIYANWGMKDRLLLFTP